MRRMRWAMYLWPGLAQLWLGGSWSGLATAVCAAATLNLALLTTFVWVELVAQGVRNTLWLVAAAGWTVSALFSIRGTYRQKAREQPDSAKDAFSEAMDYYLKGNWFQTERVLNHLLRQDPRDMEARLMLATLLRHTGRADEAAEHLNRLTKLEGAEKWQLEILRERQLLGPARSNSDTRNATQTEEAAGRRSSDPASKIVHAA